jgi:protein gp37
MDNLWDGDRRFFGEAHWRKPLEWARKANGTRPRVFANSMGDIFDNDEQVGPARSRLWQLIRETPELDWLLLTKRIGNARRMLPEDWDAGYPNVWLGITVVNQEEADRDVPKLLNIPATIRFLSCEPLLGPILLDHEWLCSEYFGHSEDCRDDLCALNGDAHSCIGRVFQQPSIDWVICGGESGSKARALDVEWAQRLREDCQLTGVAFFMKQGSQANWEDFKDFERFPPSVKVREFPEVLA